MPQQIKNQPKHTIVCDLCPYYKFTRKNVPDNIFKLLFADYILHPPTHLNTIVVESEEFWSKVGWVRMREFHIPHKKSYEYLKEL